MQVRRLLFASLLFAGCCLLPSAWAPGTGTVRAQDKKEDLKKDDTKKDEAKKDETKKDDGDKNKLDLEVLKASVKKAEEDLKKAQDEIAGLKVAGDKKTKALGDDLAAATKVVSELKTELAEVRKGGGNLKELGEKVGAVEKSAGDLKTGADELKKTAEKGVADAGAAAITGKERGDTTWLLISSALVLLMVPGLALFYGGMVRRKNVLATMMHSMAALAVVGVFWVAIGYALAFGPSVIKIDFLGAKDGGLFGWSWDLVFLKGINVGDKLPGYDIPVYLHVMFQGMFAIITPALISGAIAERIRFWPFCLFMLLWVTFVYCPLAHMVWAFDWFDPSVLAAKRGASAIGLLGKMGALDFAGGTVVHIAAGMAGLACCLVIGKRAGYPQQVAHPNSMVLTLLGAGLLWVGWFGFNGGSATNSTSLAVSAFAATQVAAAAAGLGWMLVEWLHKGKPTALGLASGIVAGLVAVTPASGFVYMYGAALIGVAAAVVCYIAVAAKNALGYDDSLDAFGVHGVGGFVGAILTGVFCSALVQGASTDGLFAYPAHRARYEKLAEKDGNDPELIAKAKAAKRAANVALIAATRDVEAEIAALKIADLEKKAEDATKLKAELAEIKLEDLEDTVASYSDDSDDKKKAAKAFEEAKAKAEEIQKKLDTEAMKNALQALADANTAKTDAEKKLDDPKAALADKAATLAALEKERDDLKALIEKQDDKANEGKPEQAKKSAMSQVMIQTKAAVFSVVFAFVLSIALVLVTQALTLGNFRTDEKSEAEGLDRTEHGEVGFDFSGATESLTVVGAVPRAASAPRGGERFAVLLTGISAKEMMDVWSDLCQPTETGPDKDFAAVYPHVTTIRGTTFACRDGDPEAVAKRLASLFTRLTKKPVTAAKV